MHRQGQRARYRKSQRDRRNILIHTLFVSFLLFFDEPSLANDWNSQIGGGSTYGSGNIGVWRTDDDGLPSYEVDPSILLRSGLSSSRPAHMLGNKIVTAIASPEGDVQLFTNRTFPRFANAYDIKAQAYGGGFGYVQSDGKVWSTAGTDLPGDADYEVVFGMGYMERRIRLDSVEVRQRIYLSRTEEALIDEVTLTNLGSKTKSIGYVPYWDVNWVFPSGLGPIKDPARVSGFYDARRNALRISSWSPWHNLDAVSLIVDPAPKTSYFVGLSHKLQSFESRKAAFLGRGGRKYAAAAVSGQSLQNGLPGLFGAQQHETVLAGRYVLEIGAGQSTTVYSAYGIADRGSETGAIDRLKATYLGEKEAIADEIRREMPELRLQSDRWLEREVAWNYYYLRAGLIKEDFWQDGGISILNQASVYLYQLGGNMALRDPLQHIMPLIHINPTLAKDTLIYALRNLSKDGGLPYGTSGYGAINNTLLNFSPSDLSLWLLWAASEYVLTTRDKDFLQMRIRGRDDLSDVTVADLLRRAYQFQVNHVGYGENGLIRLMNADWNDVLVAGSENHLLTIERGESTLNTALAAFVYERYIELLNFSGSAFVPTVAGERSKVVSALRRQWRGSYFNRAYVALDHDSVMDEVGHEGLWLEPNAFALFSHDAVSPWQRETLIEQLRTQLSDPSPNGMPLSAPSINPRFNSDTTLGSWYSINGAAVQSLLTHAAESPAAKELAWDELRKNSLAAHAEAYPEIWYGIWSGPDSYYNEVRADGLSAETPPGTSWMDGKNLLVMKMAFPLANPHAHAQLLMGIVRFAGVTVNSRGYHIQPHFPDPDFSWRTPFQSVTYMDAAAEGYLQVSSRESFELTLALPEKLSRESLVTVFINRVAQRVSPVDGVVRVIVDPDHSQRVLWRLQR